jgi:hypothetical protein
MVQSKLELFLHNPEKWNEGIQALINITSHFGSGFQHVGSNS